MSYLVGSVSSEGQPSCCRAAALVGNEDFSAITVYLSVNTAQQTIANVATSRRIAVAATHPIDHGSVQLKGTVRAVRVARSEEAALVDSYLNGFADNVEKVGFPRAMICSISHWPAFAIEVDVQEIFDQTPGPRAGSAIG